MTDRDGKRSTPEARARFRQDIGIIVWTSFLAACAETMGFFAYFDPSLLGMHPIPEAWVSNRLAGYTIGFFFFWVFTFAAATLTAYLLDTGPPRTGRS
jgi:hypothetical protein